MQDSFGGMQKNVHCYFNTQKVKFTNSPQKYIAIYVIPTYNDINITYPYIAELKLGAK